MNKLYFYTPAIKQFFNKKQLSYKDLKKYTLLKNHSVSKQQKNTIDFMASRSVLGFLRTRKPITLSHKEGYSFLGYGKNKIGIDLELLIDRDFDSLIHHIANPFEKNLFQNPKLTPYQKKLLFYELFTLKEAMIKLNNLGLKDLLSIGISPQERKFFYAPIFSIQHNLEISPTIHSSILQNFIIHNHENKKGFNFYYLRFKHSEKEFLGCVVYKTQNQ